MNDTTETMGDEITITLRLRYWSASVRLWKPLSFSVLYIVWYHWAATNNHFHTCIVIFSIEWLLLFSLGVAVAREVEQVACKWEDRRFHRRVNVCEFQFLFEQLGSVHEWMLCSVKVLWAVGRLERHHLPSMKGPCEKNGIHTFFLLDKLLFDILTLKSVPDWWGNNWMWIIKCYKWFTLHSIVLYYSLSHRLKLWKKDTLKWENIW